MKQNHHVVIIGGGFGGLYAARAWWHAPVNVTLLDKRNFHLFQPLLYQVATGGLSPGDIASPLRAVLHRQKNTRVLTTEVVDIDPQRQKVVLQEGEIFYDTLIVATGVRHHYFGHEEWAEQAPGLKTVEEALDIRRRILLAFESAELEADADMRRAWMTFVVVGGGPTGVELAGSLGELANNTLKNDFRSINPAEARIELIEGTDRILPAYAPELSASAQRALERLGVKVRTRTLTTDIQNHAVTIRKDDQLEKIPARTILWAAGIQASRLGQVLAQRAGAALDRAGRVVVAPDLTLSGHPNIFVIGDLANVRQEGKPLPGVAPVAMQQGRYVAKEIPGRLQGRHQPPFRYRDKGSLAVIGRNAAVAEFGALRLHGFPAWVIWIFVHIMYLVEFDNKLLVLVQWAWNYFTRNRGARLITGEGSLPIMKAFQNENDNK